MFECINNIFEWYQMPAHFMFFVSYEYV